MAYDDGSTLKDRFSNARRCLVAMFPSQRRPGKTYPGFIKASQRISSDHRQEIQEHLRHQHHQLAKEHWKMDDWVPMAADASRFELPHTRAHEDAFGRAGRKKTGPQLAVLTLYHIVSGLPWDWTIGPGTASERHQLRELLPTLPQDVLLMLDAGFPGYELFCKLNRCGVSFLARVGANVTLLKDAGLEIEQDRDVVWLWPTGKRSKRPLRLRLIHIRPRSDESQARQDVYLLTNVLEKTRLSDEDAKRYYPLRWGVEVFYRSIKHTFDAHKLLSRSPRQALDELHWAMTAILLLGLMSVDALKSADQAPSRLSIAEALRTVRTAMSSNNLWRRNGDLRVLLTSAHKDTYCRRGPKTSRGYPRKKNQSPPKPPNIHPLTNDEITPAKRIYDAA